mmetsp:Transcript_8566/g.21293  ORF Transcript_8566/g.21293 Transcript_8566/m.21293 type:complete len:103 (+) Transcript_8566:78-386(+)
MPIDPIATVNYKFPTENAETDPVANINLKEERVRAGWVKIMWARDAREEVRQCYRREGVNHLDNCKEFVQAYLAAIEVPFFNGVKQNMAKISALDKEDAKKD